jgi:pSer/pThr/pTyr-binding forkhead associated (FHA) protein
MVIKCPSCQKRHPANTLFCDECGAYLAAEEVNKHTDPLAMGNADWMEETESVTSGPPDLEADGLLTLKLAIRDSGRIVEYPLSKEISIGRLDAASATFPDVDLSEDGGLEKGVSRRHARITRQGINLFIEDLGSVNGTFLNGKRLTPYLPHPLEKGDEVQIGRLVLRVKVV